MGCHRESTNLGDVKYRRAGKEKAEEQQVSVFPTSSSWSPKKEQLGSNLPVEFAYGAGYSQCESKFYYFDGHNMQQGQQKDMRIFKPLTSSSALPGGFQPWTWLLGLGFNVKESPWMAQTTSTSMKTGKGMIWEVTGGKEWVLKFWLCEMRKKYHITKKHKKEISDKQRSKKLTSWVLYLGANHSNNPHLSIRHFLGEKKQTEMESEASNCMFYLLFSFLLVKKKGPKSNNNPLWLILQNTLSSQIPENEILFSPTVLYQLFCLLCKRGLWIQ